MALLWKATGAMADSEGRIPVMELPWRVKISMKEGCGAAERLRNCWSFGERGHVQHSYGNATRNYGGY